VTGGGSEDPAANQHHETRSEVSGSAGDVVQARDVQGGVHFHHTTGHATESTPQQLPGDVRGFVDRARELDHLDGALAEDRNEPSVVSVSVITGTAGVGKTALAVHWAHRVRRRFPDGQLYVDLHGYDPGPAVQPDEALERFLRALDVPSAAIPTSLEGKAALYRSRVADRRLLIVLDNAATVGQVRPLLPGTAGCLVLITSRNRLSGLVVRDGARRLSLDVLAEPDAVALLRTVTAGYRETDSPEELRELSRLCARLPLALRIAAERAASRPLMLLDALIGDLKDESSLWDALTAENGEEADAVRTVFAWSYRALTEDAARLFRLLGMHPGPEFSVAAAAALAGASVGPVRRLLDSLVGSHLIEQTAPDRYQFHDLLRAYAADQALSQEPEPDRLTALRRLLTWYLHTADAAAAHLTPLVQRIQLGRPVENVIPSAMSDYGQSLRWYEAERTNLVAATRTAAVLGLDEIAWQLPVVLRAVYAERHEFGDWTTTGEIGLTAARRLGDRRGEAEALESLGKAAFRTRQLDRAEDYHRAALALRVDTGDRFGEAVSINALGLVCLRHRRLTDAIAHFEHSMAIGRELENRRWIGVLLGNLGETRFELGQLPEAAHDLAAGLVIVRELGDRGLEGNALFFQSMTQREQGLTSDAQVSIQGALTIAREHDNHSWAAHWSVEFARVQRALGKPAESLASYQYAVSVQRRLGDRSREGTALDGTGEAYRELGRAAEAIDFHRQAVRIHRELGDEWQLAIALDNLATAQAETGATDEAARQWDGALASLASCDDPRAGAMRDRISARLG